MLVQKNDEAGFLINTFELKLSMKMCCCDDYLLYAYMYICTD